MVTRTFNKTGEEVSLLGFGMMRLPLKRGRIDLDETRRIVRFALDNGVNYFDTAYMYHNGKSEPALKYALEGVPRSSYFLADKMPSWMLIKKSDAEKVFSEQLSRCGVEYFDFYLCHSLNKGYFKKYEKYLLDFLIKKKEEGRIRHLGFSFHDDAETLDYIAGYHKWDFAQIQYNYLDYNDYSKELFEILKKRGIPVIIMEPVRGGLLATLNDKAKNYLKAANPDVSIASWAIRFAMNEPEVLTVLSGMSNFEQVEDNIKTAKNFKPLSKEENDIIFNALGIYKKDETVPCTGCRYCMDCPSGVDIPQNFKIFNDFAVSKNSAEFMEQKAALAERGANSCIECGICKELCPQKINIPRELKKIAKNL